jgi:hypothetical protein
VMTSRTPIWMWKPSLMISDGFEGHIKCCLVFFWRWRERLV